MKLQIRINVSNCEAYSHPVQLGKNMKAVPHESFSAYWQVRESLNSSILKKKEFMAGDCENLKVN